MFIVFDETLAKSKRSEKTCRNAWSDMPAHLVNSSPPTALAGSQFPCWLSRVSQAPPMDNPLLLYWLFQRDWSPYKWHNDYRDDQVVIDPSNKDIGASDVASCWQMKSWAQLCVTNHRNQNQSGAIHYLVARHSSSNFWNGTWSKPGRGRSSPRFVRGFFPGRNSAFGLIKAPLNCAAVYLLGGGRFA